MHTCVVVVFLELRACCLVHAIATSSSRVVSLLSSTASFTVPLLVFLWNIVFDFYLLFHAPFRPLPAVLCGMTPEIWTVIIFSSGLLMTSSAVLGGAIAGHPVPAGHSAVAVIVLIVLLLFDLDQ